MRSIALLKTEAIVVLLVAAALTLFQIVDACVIGGQADFAQTYASLCQFDSFWFRSIETEGYHSVVPPAPLDPARSNVAFFPGYPLCARALYLAGVPWDVSLLCIAQVATVGVWVFMLLLLRRHLNSVATAISVLAALAYPGTFFLITGNSESLLVASMLGFIYWSTLVCSEEKTAAHRVVMACTCGFLLAATKIVGMMVSPFPLVLACLKRQTGLATRAGVWKIGAAISIIAAFGGLLFLAYCQLRWHHWDLYMQTQKIGWGVGMNWLAPLNLSAYVHAPITPDGFVGRIYLIVLVSLSIVEIIAHFRRSGKTTHNTPERITLLLFALVLFYVTVGATVGNVRRHPFESLARYVLPVHYLVILIFANWFSDEMVLTRLQAAFSVRVRKLLLCGLYALMAIISAASFLVVEQFLLHHYMHGGWVG